MKRSFRICGKTALFLGVIVCLASSSAMAQKGFGIRAGASFDPEQFHFGGHYITNPLVGTLTFRPNLEIGVGDGVTTVATNFEFAYHFKWPTDKYSTYVGAGPALNIYNFGDSGNYDGDTDVRGGVNILVGLEHRNGFFGELKMGLIHSPEAKFTVGYTFR